MNYAQLEKTISEKRQHLSKLSKELRQVSFEIDSLNNKIEELLSSMFIDYLNLNETFEIKRYCNFSGIQVAIKDTPPLNHGSSIWPGHFSIGDKIEVIKKNKRSLVIRCVCKKLFKFDNQQRVIEFVNPQSQFRVNVDDFRNFLLSDSEFKNNFTTWLKRKNSLDDLISD